MDGLNSLSVRIYNITFFIVLTMFQTLIGVPNFSRMERPFDTFHKNQSDVQVVESGGVVSRQGEQRN